MGAAQRWVDIVPLVSLPAKLPSSPSADVSQPERVVCVTRARVWWIGCVLGRAAGLGIAWVLVQRGHHWQCPRYASCVGSQRCRAARMGLGCHVDPTLWAGTGAVERENFWIGSVYACLSTGSTNLAEVRVAGAFENPHAIYSCEKECPSFVYRGIPSFAY